MASAITKYAFINAKLRARLSKNVSDDIFTEIINAKSFLESIEHLKNTPYDAIYNIFTETGDILTAEKEMLKKEIALLTEILKYVNAETSEYIKALALRYEINNVKNCIRLYFDSHIRGRDISQQTPYVIHDKIINTINCDRIIHATSREEMAHALRGTPYYEIVTLTASEMDRTSTVFPVETALDRFYYDNLYEQISASLSAKDKKIALKVFYLDVDVENIGRMMRFKHFYNLKADEALRYVIPYGIVPSNIDAFEKMYGSDDVSGVLSNLMEKSDASLKSLFNEDMRDRGSRLLLVEKIVEQILQVEARKILYGPPFTIGIIIAYFTLKQHEIKKIMTILNAKNYHYQPERINGLL
jgi:V/A-type H+-transporting ATPase subunit C